MLAVSTIFLLCILRETLGTYTLQSVLTDESSFFGFFDFETMNDPTNGVVDYIDRESAVDLGLVGSKDGKIYIGADHTSIVPPDARGRKSIRLSSKSKINGTELLILDVSHMPSTNGKILSSGCSVWPAFWTVGANWPNGGEIDIIEYVNTDSVTKTTLHTNDGCDESFEDTSTFSGHWGTSSSGHQSSNCYIYASGQDTNAGCSIVGPADTAGKAFNDKGGGVFATVWDKNSVIRSYFFSHDSVPADIAANKPDPSTWGKPYASFTLTSPSSPSNYCSSDHFKEHNIVFDTTFCGDWAGNVFASACHTSMSCEEFVRSNPSEFEESYWLINSMSIYSDI